VSRRAARLGQSLKEPDPDTLGRPADEPIVERLARAADVRRIDPAPARLEDMNDAADHPTIIHARLASCVARQVLSELRELRVRQLETVPIHKRSPQRR
jgi:hypothetical protein